MLNRSVFLKHLADSLQGVVQSSLFIALLVTLFQVGIRFWGDFVIFKGFTAKVLGLGIEDALLNALLYFFYAATLFFLSSCVKAIAIRFERYFMFFCAINASFSLFLLVWSLSIYVSSSSSLEPSPSLAFGLSLSISLVSLVAIQRFGWKRG